MASASPEPTPAGMDDTYSQISAQTQQINQIIQDALER